MDKNPPALWPDSDSVTGPVDQDQLTEESVDGQEWLSRNPFFVDAGKALLVGAIGMFGTFLLYLVQYTIPLQILRVEWQLSVITGVLKWAAFPVIGIIFIYLSGLFLDLEDQKSTMRTERWLFFCKKISAFACIGFLLFIPLQVKGMITLSRMADAPPESEIRGLKFIHEEIKATNNFDELNTVLQKLATPPEVPTNLKIPFNEFRDILDKRFASSINELTTRLRGQIADRREKEGYVFSKVFIACIFYAFIYGSIGQVFVPNPFRIFDKRRLNASEGMLSNYENEPEHPSDCGDADLADLELTK